MKKFIIILSAGILFFAIVGAGIWGVLKLLPTEHKYYVSYIVVTKDGTIPFSTIVTAKKSIESTEEINILQKGIKDQYKGAADDVIVLSFDELKK